MARRKGVLHEIAKAQREAERRQQEQIRAQTQAARAVERAQRELERAQKADERERARLYAEARQAEVELKTEEVAGYVDRLGLVLSSTLDVDDYFDLSTLKKSPIVPPFNPGLLARENEVPVLDVYLPRELSRVKRLMPGTKEKHEQAVAAAHRRYEEDVERHRHEEVQRLATLARAKAQHDDRAGSIIQEVEQQNREIDQLIADVRRGDPSSLSYYFSLVLESSAYPDGFPHHVKLAYVPESKQLVLEYDLPAFEVVPEVATYKYVKARDEITTSSRPISQRRSLYASVIAQVTLRTLHEVFESDRFGNVDTIVFNGHVDTIDPATGRSVRPCLVSLRTTRDTFLEMDLRRVDPVACLQALNASVSKNPTELSPVRPVLEFSMVDHRFIEETDVLSELDQRPNLMELSPGEFESLISNLFQKMGLETRLTRASRDGGVDCVAYDPRPIFGGKVVIQAKRYKNTVDVSSVRDLYGTVQNEGASKGILVTTSGYGKASFEFATGKPLELLDGGNLLHLLSEHAGIEARIVVPEG